MSSRLVRRVVLAATFVLLTSTAALVPLSTHALDLVPAENGRIFHQQGFPSTLYSIEPDGTDRRQVSPSGMSVTNHRASPDGEQILFTGDGNNLFVMGADGSDLLALTDTANVISGDFSPDGSTIAFSVASEGIWLMDRDGTDKRQLIQTQNLQTLRYSPDGTKLLAQTIFPTNVTVTLGVVPASAPVTLPIAPGFQADWVTNDRIVYATDGASGTIDLHAVDTDGTDVTPVYEGPGIQKGAEVSPDGQKVVFDSLGQTATSRLDGSDFAILGVWGTSSYAWAPKVFHRVSAFAAPVNADQPNIAAAGRTLPLRVRVTDSEGTAVLGLTDAHVVPDLEPCDGATAGDVIETYASGAGLIELSDGNYQYNYRTPRSWKGLCGTLTLHIDGAEPRSAEFIFR